MQWGVPGQGQVLQHRLPEGSMATAQALLQEAGPAAVASSAGHSRHSSRSRRGSGVHKGNECTRLPQHKGTLARLWMVLVRIWMHFLG